MLGKGAFLSGLERAVQTLVCRAWVVLHTFMVPQRLLVAVGGRASEAFVRSFSSVTQQMTSKNAALVKATSTHVARIH